MKTVAGFPYESFILTDEGKRELGGIFVKWLQGKYALPKVKSFNNSTGTFDWKNIVKVYHRGEQPLVEIRAANRKIKCVANHLFLTGVGWKEAAELVEGDLLIASNPDDLQIIKSLSGDQEQIFLGSFLGDGSFDSCGINRQRMRVVHGMKQEAYCQWKAAMFDATTSIALNTGYNPDQPKVVFSTHMYASRLNFPCPAIYCPQELIERMDLKALAIWYMDDGSSDAENKCGTISVHALDEGSVFRLVEMLGMFGIEAKTSHYDKGWIIRLTKEPYLKFCELIAPYIHPDLAYKIPENMRDRINLSNWTYEGKDYGYVIVGSVSDYKKKAQVFDLELEDGNNFIVTSSSRGVNARDGGVAVASF